MVLKWPYNNNVGDFKKNFRKNLIFVTDCKVNLVQISETSLKLLIFC